MAIQTAELGQLRSKYALRSFVVAFLIVVAALAGALGTLASYRIQKSNNEQVNVSGRQRFLSALILLDLHQLEKSQHQEDVVFAINKKRKLMQSALETLQVQPGLQAVDLRASKFATDETPNSLDLFQETADFVELTNPEHVLNPDLMTQIERKQKAFIAPAWDAYTGQISRQNDAAHFHLVLFVVTCFSALSLIGFWTGLKIVRPLTKDVDQLISRHQELSLINLETSQSLKVSSKYASLGEQVGNINHDMNNIISVICAFVATFKRQIADQPDLLHRFEKLEKAVDRLAALTSALRRSLVGSSGTQIETFPMIEVIRDCEIILSDKFKKNNVALDLEVDIKLTVTVRKETLYQALLNLLGNAVEARQGTFGAWVRLESSEDAHSVYLRVIDSGTGLPPEASEKLFTPFFTTKESGTGIGLRHIRQIISEDGGELSYDSEFANTCFVLRIPKTSRSPSVGESASTRKTS